MRYTLSVALLAGSALLAGCVTTGPKPKATLPATAQTTSFGHPLPEGAPLLSQPIVSSPYIGTHQKVAVQPWRVAHFRPNPNMPEFLNADVIHETLVKQDAAALSRRLENGNSIMMTLPRIELLPCDTGCIGNKDYDKMAARFLKAYDDWASSPTIAYRGSMRVKVRWFQQKTFLQRTNPLSTQQEVFAIQFPLEGNMLTLSQTSWGKDSKPGPLVDRVAMYLRMAVITPLSFGLRNYATIKLAPEYDPSVVENVDAWGASFTASMRDLLGQEDLRSRLEAPGAQDHALYPAIDGIAPGEGRQLPAPHYFESL